MFNRFRSSILLGVALLGTSPLAMAQPATPEARQESYRKGWAALEAKNWEEALQIFAELWAQDPTYDVALNLGQAELNLERYRDAAEHFAFAVRHIPPGEKRSMRGETIELLGRAKKHVGTLRVTVDRPRAEIRIDGKVIGTSPIEGELFVEPGSHSIEATLPGYAPGRQAFEVKAGEERALDLALGPVDTSSKLPFTSMDLKDPPSKPANGGTSHDSGPRTRTIVLVAGSAVAAIGLGAFIGFRLSAESERDTVDRLAKQHGDSACADPTPPSDCNEQREAAESYDRKINWSTASLVVAGAAAAGTVACLFWCPQADAAASSATRTSVRVTPGFAPEAAMLWASGSF